MDLRTASWGCKGGELGKGHMPLEPALSSGLGLLGRIAACVPSGWSLLEQLTLLSN